MSKMTMKRDLSENTIDFGLTMCPALSYGYRKEVGNEIVGDPEWMKQQQQL